MNQIWGVFGADPMAHINSKRCTRICAHKHAKESKYSLYDSFNTVKNVNLGRNKKLKHCNTLLKSEKKYTHLQ